MEGLNFSSPLNITIENTEGKTKEYKVLVYAFTGLPVMYINTENDTEITSKEEYVNAHLRIVEDIYTRSGEIFESDVTIKGRGNSTWSLPKKPYALKLIKRLRCWVNQKINHGCYWPITRIKPICEMKQVSLWEESVIWNGHQGLTL